MIKEFNKIELLADICKFYNYELTLNTDNRVRCIGEDGYSTEYKFTYDNIDNALLGWVDTLIDTDEDALINDCETFWSEEIAFIKNIELSK